MKTKAAWLGLGVVVVALALGGGLGCETTETTDTVIAVSPGEVVVTNAAQTVVFTASYASTNVALAMPLQWSVSDDSLGIIKSSAGMTAIYESKGKVGNNSVTVKDQGQAEGVAIVNQR